MAKKSDKIATKLQQNCSILIPKLKYGLTSWYDLGICVFHIMLRLCCIFCYTYVTLVASKKPDFIDGTTHTSVPIALSKVMLSVIEAVQILSAHIHCLWP